MGEEMQAMGEEVGEKKGWGRGLRVDYSGTRTS